MGIGALLTYGKRTEELIERNHERGIVEYSMLLLAWL